MTEIDFEDLCALVRATRFAATVTDAKAASEDGDFSTAVHLLQAAREDYRHKHSSGSPSLWELSLDAQEL